MYGNWTAFGPLTRRDLLTPAEAGIRATGVRIAAGLASLVPAR
jgi:hypothetical protein